MTNEWKNRIKLMLFVGVPLGIGLIFIRNAFNLSNDATVTIFSICSIIIITISVVHAMRAQIKLSKIVGESYQSYQETNDLEKYIGELESFIAKTNLEANKNILLLNMSIAYVDHSDYDKAISALKRIDPKTLKGNLKVVYFNNLVHYNFRAGNDDEAIDIMEDRKAEFDKFASKPEFKGGFILNKALKLIVEGNTEDALDLMEEHEDLFLDTHLSEAHEYVLSRI